MRLATITIATALGLGTVSIPTVGMADWRGDSLPSHPTGRKLGLPHHRVTSWLSILRPTPSRSGSYYRRAPHPLASVSPLMDPGPTWLTWPTLRCWFARRQERS